MKVTAKTKHSKVIWRPESDLRAQQPRRIRGKGKQVITYQYGKFLRTYVA